MAYYQQVSVGIVEQTETAFFFLTLACYLVGTFCYEALFVFKTPRLGRWALGALIVGGVANAFVVGLRWVRVGHPPLTNIFEVLSLWALLIVIAYLIVERVYQYRVIGAFVAPLVLLSLWGASLAPSAASPLDPQLRSPWLPIHVGLAFIAYAMFTVALGAAVIYLLQERQLKARRPHALYYRLPPLDTMDDLSYRTAAMGFVFMALGLLTGAVWAEQAWGAYWSWEPKQTTALVTWLVYAAYFHTRNVAGWHGRRASWLLVVGFVSVLFTFLGVAFIGPGQHSFAIL